MTPVQILLIDDHALFRSGLKLVLLGGLPDAQVLEAESLEQAVQMSGRRLWCCTSPLHLMSCTGRWSG